MRTAMVGVLAVVGLWCEVATAESLRVGGAARVHDGDAGAERVLSGLRSLPRLGQRRDAGRVDEPRPMDRADENTMESSAWTLDEASRGFEFVTTRRLGEPAWMIRDRSTFTVLWEARVRLRSGRQWGLELTSIRERDAFDRTSVAPWPF